MGDRALIVFADKHEVSPAVYVHWHGSRVRDLLTEAAPHLRAGDIAYAAARFCGHLHTQIDGGLGLGMFALDPRTEAESEAGWAARVSHGDNGVFVVDVDTGEVRQHSRSGKREFKIDLGKF